MVTGNGAVGQPSQHTERLQPEIPKLNSNRSRTYPLLRKVKLDFKKLAKEGDHPPSMTSLNKKENVIITQH